MDSELLSRLRHPLTQNTVQFDRQRGVLESNRPVETGKKNGVPSAAANVWPVVHGIPRFVASEHLESFGRQWNRYDVAHDDEDRATFVAKTGLPLAALAGTTILDAGCGGGRYCKVAGEAGARIIGVDHSSAVDKASELCAHLSNVSFVQADLKQLPFAPGSFDIVFSIGVLHHDIQTRPAFNSIARMVRPGGTLAVWLYRRNQFWQEWLNSFLRRQTIRMPHDRLEKYCQLGAFLGRVPVLNKTLNKVVNFSAHPERSNRVCDTFDWYAPRYQHHHTVDEVQSWFQAEGFDCIEVLPPEKQGRLYRWAYNRNLLIGSGVNLKAIRQG